MFKATAAHEVGLTCHMPIAPLFYSQASSIKDELMSTWQRHSFVIPAFVALNLAVEVKGQIYQVAVLTDM